MLNISVNNDLYQLEKPITISELLNNLNYDSSKVVVAINNNFVPRSEHQAWLLNNHDRVDILSAIQGG